MRRFVIKAIILVLVLLSALAGATAGRADESLSPVEIGSPPSCDNEVELSLAAVDCAGIEPVEALGPVDPAIEQAAVTTASAERALVAAEGPDALRRNCRLHAEVALYTANDWIRLGQTLAAEATHCADYYISIQPARQRQDRSALRPGPSEFAHSGRAFTRWPRRT
jgi:hypothetical protein